MGKQPSSAGATQLITTFVPEIVVVGKVGGEGAVGTVAPPPGVE